MYWIRRFRRFFPHAENPLQTRAIVRGLRQPACRIQISRDAEPRNATAGRWCRDRWLNPPELVESVPEVVPGFPDRLVPRNSAAAAILKKRTLSNLYNTRGTPEGARLASSPSITRELARRHDRGRATPSPTEQQSACRYSARISTEPQSHRGSITIIPLQEVGLVMNSVALWLCGSVVILKRYRPRGPYRVE